MIQLIPIALFVLAGFSSVINAAPTQHAGAISAGPSTTMEDIFVGAINTVPSNNWKRHHHQEAEEFMLSNQFINKAIARSTAEHSIMEMVKRQSDVTGGTESGAPEISFEDMFRNFFDKVIDHIIEVTSLNDIVHGNYDILYDLFIEKLQDLAANIGDSLDNGSEDDDDFEKDDNEKDDEDEDEEEDDDEDDGEQKNTPENEK